MAIARLRSGAAQHQRAARIETGLGGWRTPNLGRGWEKSSQTWEDPRENHGKIMGNLGKSWGILRNLGEIMGKLGENHGEIPKNGDL